MVFCFFNEKAINAIYFKTIKDIRYSILVYGSEMACAEFEFQTKELYDEALNTWIEYEKIKNRPSYLMGIDLSKGDR